MAQEQGGLRVPPHNIESERALLGSIMLKPDALHDVIDLVTPSAFYSEKHRYIFETMLELFRKSEPIDLLSVSSRLKNKKLLEQIGGGSYLTELVNTVPSTSNVKYYAELVHRTHVLRSLIDAASEIGELGFEESEEIDEILDKAEKRIYDITNSPNIHKFSPIAETLADAWERFDALHQDKGKLRGVPTGFRDLDNLLAGLQPADLVILAARPSMGKTSLALDIARQTAVHHSTPVGIFSLEMSGAQLADRMVSAEARVDSWKLRTGNITSDTDFDRLGEAVSRLSSAPVYIDDQPANNVLKMRSVARRLKREHGLKLVVVDYLQLIVPTQSRTTDSLVQQVTEISRSLKTLARELEIPVLALSQLSRAVEQRRGKPRLSDLRDSGSIEQDADVVMFIHRDDKYNEGSTKPNIAEILIEKHRNGPLGKVELYFDEKKTTFLSIEKSDFGAMQEPQQAGRDAEDVF